MTAIGLAVAVAVGAAVLAARHFWPPGDVSADPGGGHRQPPGLMQLTPVSVPVSVPRLRRDGWKVEVEEEEENEDSYRQTVSLHAPVARHPDKNELATLVASMR
jgi:hypothetical protein